MKFPIILTILIFISSCSGAGSKNKFKDDVTKRIYSLWDRYTSELSDDQITSVADKKPMLPKPFVMAVYFTTPDKKQDWRWTPEDRKKMLLFIGEKKKVVKKTFELINTSGKDEELKGLRMMAAQQGADSLLVVQGVAEVETDANGMAVTYLVLLPMLFANGNDVSSVFVTQAVLWDVRNAYVHIGTQSEGNWSMKRPLAFRQKDRAIHKAKEESLNQLQLQLGQQLNQIKLSTAKPPKKEGFLKKFL